VLIRIVYFCGLVMLVFILYNLPLIGYGLMQAKGQYKVLSEAKPLSYYTNQVAFPDSLKEKIYQLEKIKTYAIQEFQLPAETQYNSLYDQKGEDILWVVTACDPFKLRSYKWSFPLLGEVTYKGFFDKQKAEETFKSLQKEGYDVRIRSVSAWSTLGWFSDPILSNMLQRSTAKLAEVVFHELIHDVIYLKDSTDFNENLASFIAQELTLKYVNGSSFSPEEVLQYEHSLEDSRKLYSFMNSQVLTIDSVYGHMDSLDLKGKTVAKEALFEQMRERLMSLNFHQNQIKTNILENQSFNNANLMAYERYGSLQSILEEQMSLKFHSDILQMLAYYRKNFDNI
jgi:predicted aminopeptidase